MSIYLNDTLKSMNKDVKRIKTRDEMLVFLAKYFLDINMIHPFREGNGRTLREFLREYIERISLENGLDYEINYKLIEGELKKKYMIASIRDDQKLMVEVFDNIVVERVYKNEKNICK